MARGNQGQFLGALVRCRSGSVLPDVAEVLGIKEALSWIKEESDCLVAVQSLRSSVSMQSYFGRLVRACKLLLFDLKPKNVSIKFIKRSANTAAHFLAKSSSVVSDHKLSFHDLSPEFKALLLNDSS